MDFLWHTRVGMFAILVLLMLLMWRTLRSRDRNHESAFYFDDLLTDSLTGKASPSAVILLASFVMATWLIVYLAVSGKLTETYFTAYLGAYVAPIIASIIMRNKASAPTLTALQKPPPQP